MGSQTSTAGSDLQKLGAQHKDWYRKSMQQALGPTPARVAPMTEGPGLEELDRLREAAAASTKELQSIRQAHQAEVRRLRTALDAEQRSRALAEAKASELEQEAACRPQVGDLLAATRSLVLDMKPREASGYDETIKNVTEVETLREELSHWHAVTQALEAQNIALGMQLEGLRPPLSVEVPLPLVGSRANGQVLSGTSSLEKTELATPTIEAEKSQAGNTDEVVRLKQELKVMREKQQELVREAAEDLMREQEEEMQAISVIFNHRVGNLWTVSNALQNEVDQLTALHEEALEAVARERKEAERLRGLLDKPVAEVDGLEAKVPAEADPQGSLEEEAQQLRCEVAELRSRAAEMDAKEKEIQAISAAFEHRVRELRNVSIAFEAEVDELTALREEAFAAAAREREEVERLRGLLDKPSAEEEQLQAISDAVEKRVRELRTVCLALEAEVEQLTALHDEAIETAERERREVERLRAFVDQPAMEAISEAVENRVRELRNVCLALEAEVEQQTALHDEAIETAERERCEVKRLRALVDQPAMEALSSRAIGGDEGDTLRLEVDSLKSQLLEAGDRQKSLEDEVHRLEIKLSSAGDTQKSLEDEVHRLQTKLLSTGDTQKSLEDEARLLRSNVAALQSRHAELEAEADAANRRADSPRPASPSPLALAPAPVEALAAASVEPSSEELAALRAQLLTWQHEHAVMTEQHRLLCHDHNDLREKHRSLQQDHSNLSLAARAHEDHADLFRTDLEQLQARGNSWAEGCSSPHELDKLNSDLQDALERRQLLEEEIMQQQLLEEELRQRQRRVEELAAELPVAISLPASPRGGKGADFALADGNASAALSQVLRDEMEREMAAARDEHQQAIEALEARAARSAEESQEMLQQRAALTQEVQRHREEAAQHFQRALELSKHFDSQRESLEAEARDLKTQVAQHRSRADFHADEAEELKMQVDKHRSRADFHADEVRQLTEDFSRQQDKLMLPNPEEAILNDSLRLAAERSAREVEVIRAAYEDLQLHHSVLQDAHEASGCVREAADRQQAMRIEDLQRQVADLRRQVAVTEQLRGACEALEGHVAQLNQQLELADAERDSIEAERKALLLEKTQLEAMNEELHFRLLHATQPGQSRHSTTPLSLHRDDRGGGREGESLRVPDVAPSRGNADSANIDAISAAAAWVGQEQRGAAPPLSGTPSRRYCSSGGAIQCLVFEDFRDHLQAVAEANDSGREEVAQAIASGDLARMAFEQYLPHDPTQQGFLVWDTYQVCNFVSDVFLEFGFSSPTEDEIQPLYRQIDVQGRGVLNALECLWLVDALFRSVFSDDLSVTKAPLVTSFASTAPYQRAEPQPVPRATVSVAEVVRNTSPPTPPAPLPIPRAQALTGGAPSRFAAMDMDLQALAAKLSWQVQEAEQKAMGALRSSSSPLVLRAQGEQKAMGALGSSSRPLAAITRPHSFEDVTLPPGSALSPRYGATTHGAPDVPRILSGGPYNSSGQSPLNCAGVAVAVSRRLAVEAPRVLPLQASTPPRPQSAATLTQGTFGADGLRRLDPARIQRGVPVGSAGSGGAIGSPVLSIPYQSSQWPGSAPSSAGAISSCPRWSQ